MSSDEDVANLERFLSIERLATFKKITGSSREAIALHHETLRLGAQMMSVMAVIEVALRNAVHEKLVGHYGVPNCLTEPPEILKWQEPEKNKIRDASRSARRAAYAKLTQAQKRELDQVAFPDGVPEKYKNGGRTAYLRLVAERQRQIPISVGQIVAQLTFFFWKRLYSKEYEHVLWKPLKTVFPDRRLKRADVATQLEKLYQSRNRVAHHEPIFGRRLHETIDAIHFFLSNFDGKDSSGTSHIGRLLNDDFNSLKASADEIERRIRAYRI
jgi:hypothetical protein